MNVYQFAIGILLTIFSVALIAWPRQVWQFGRGWRFANPGTIELSPTYLSWLRASGAVGATLGVMLFLAALR
jgi:hypothetical protein